MRILPRVNEDVNEEWLADKSRHAPVDGLKTQRLTTPFLRPSRQSELQSCDWEDALISVVQAINNCDGGRVEAVVGPQTDAETMFALKELLAAVGSDRVYLHQDADIDPTCMPSSRGKALFLCFFLFQDLIVY